MIKSATLIVSESFNEKKRKKKREREREMVYWKWDLDIGQSHLQFKNRLLNRVVRFFLWRPRWWQFNKGLHGAINFCLKFTSFARYVTRLKRLAFHAEFTVTEMLHKFQLNGETWTEPMVKVSQCRSVILFLHWSTLLTYWQSHDITISKLSSCKILLKNLDDSKVPRF